MFFRVLGGFCGLVVLGFGDFRRLEGFRDLTTFRVLSFRDFLGLQALLGSVGLWWLI